MRRSFKRHCDAMAPPGRLHLDVAFAQTASEEQSRLVPLVFTEFAALATSGALSGNRIDPAASSLIAEPTFSTGQGLTQIFRQVRIDANALTCLLNTLEWIHAQVLPLTAVQISWDQVNSREPVAASEFPSMWQQLSYQLEISEELDRRFDIEVEFASSQPTEVLDKVNTHFGMWFTGVNRGAYAEEGQPIGSSAIFLTDDVMTADANGIVWFIDRLAANDSALDALVNALEKLHKTLVPLRKVTIS